MSKCLQCPNIIPYEKRKNKFCSKSCAASFNNQGRQRTIESRLKTSAKLLGKTYGKTHYSVSDWNWSEIQNYYDNGHSTRECQAKFKFSFHIEKSAKEQKLFCTRPPQKFDLQSALVENSTAIRSYVKKYLIQDGILENECSNCGQLPVWDSKPLVLVLDHINGINNDNRLENLRLLCPNCNSQTETFCKGGEKRKAPVRTKELIDAIRQTETIKDALLSLGMEPSANNYARITRLTA